MLPSLKKGGLVKNADFCKMPRFRKESLNGPCKIEIRKVHFPWTQVLN